MHIHNLYGKKDSQTKFEANPMKNDKVSFKARGGRGRGGGRGKKRRRKKYVNIVIDSYMLQETHKPNLKEIA